MRTDEATFEDQLRSLARIQNPEVVREQLAGIRTEDLAEGLQRLDTSDVLNILSQLEPEDAADLLVELPTETARRVLDELPDATLAHYIDLLPMDDAADLREELPPERFEALLEVIPREDAEEIRRLLAFPEDSAGQLMTEAFVAVKPHQPISEILREIREAPEEQYETVNDIYVLDEHRHLLGIFSLREAVRAPEGATAAEVMHTDIISYAAQTPGEEVARQIARYGFYAMPVLDHRGRMLGIFTVDDAQEILEDADTEDVLKLGAVTGDAEPYLSLSVFSLFKRRVVWLFALFVAETFTGYVLRYYGEGTDGTKALSLSPLTFFIPLLIGAGGNSGSQVTTTITRALALGEIRAGDWLRVIKREFLTALLVGATLGIAGYFRALLWQSGPHLSLVVGLALPAIVIWATTVGSLLPIGAKRLGIDPAVMSAPFITTFVDATGLIIYFEIALRLIPSSALGK